MSKFRFLLGLMLIFFVLSGGYGCAIQKELIKFTTESNYLILTKIHINSVSLKSDAAGKNFVNVRFSKEGQRKISEFTGNNINNKLSIIINDKVLIKSIKIREKLSSESMMFSFSSDKEAKEFLSMVEGEI